MLMNRSLKYGTVCLILFEYSNIFGCVDAEKVNRGLSADSFAKWPESFTQNF